MKKSLCLILGGGRGTRLAPLTKDRSKPAVPFAGKYRLIDIPISNSLHSGLNNIYVLTQFNSESLNKHVARTYKLDAFTQGFVEIMAAEQTMEHAGWYQGTADAVRKCLKHINNPNIEHIFILSGDHLYKMDFNDLLEFHKSKKAEITIACNPTPAEEVSDLGIMRTDKDQRISNFIEKPKSEAELSGMAVEINGQKRYLASMGIYLFNKEVLRQILIENNKADFGKEIIPDYFSKKLTYAYTHQGYWRDIGTIKAFYEENLIFTDAVPPVDLFNEHWQFFTRPRFLPPAKFDGANLERVVIGEGSILHQSKIKHSIIGVRSRIAEEVAMEDTVMMGADYYQSILDIENDKRSGIPPIGIGRGCIIKKAIIDKNARIGENVKIINQNKLDSSEGSLYYIKDGIVIIPKNTVIPANTVI